MAGLNQIPTEVLHNIVSNLSPDFTDLRNCCLVSRALWNVAASILYSHIELNIDERCDGDEEAYEKSQRRQRRLLRSLAKNPKLGAMVRTFKSYQVPIFASPRDATLVRAAKNMKYLSRAFLTPSPLAAHVIGNLSSYSQLVDLHVYGLSPEEHIWSTAPASLTTLKWQIPAEWTRGQYPLEVSQILVNVVEKTCSFLESLDISIIDMRTHQPTLPVVPPERVDQYRQANSSASTNLTHLQHFGFKYTYNPNQSSDVEAALLDFIRKHKQSLKSISIPVGCGSWKRESLDFILKVCEMLPDLRDLTLEITQTGQEGQAMNGFDFLHALTTALASPKFSIERFSVADIGVPFSPAVGNLFSSWTNLKFLRLGDADNAGRRGPYGHDPSPYGHDGRLNFHRYRGAILGFIKNLPASLQELYLEINGEDLWCDSDSDFDPVCNLGTLIFDTLRRLHTCDIHAWISNCDGGLGPIPEKGVFYRRLTHKSKTPNDLPESKIKDVWTSRMDCIYQESDAVVTTECVEVELEDGEGVFEGRDANKVWCDGFEFDAHQGQTTETDYSWPFWEDKVGSYAMFRKRY